MLNFFTNCSWHFFHGAYCALCSTKYICYMQWHPSVRQNITGMSQCCTVCPFKEWYNTLLTDLALPKINYMLRIYILHTKDGYNNLDTTFYQDSLWNQTCPVILLWHACKPANNMYSLKYSLLREKLLYKAIKAYKIYMLHIYFNHKLQNARHSQATAPISHSVAM
jgi:hypothetical protein